MAVTRITYRDTHPRAGFEVAFSIDWTTGEISEVTLNGKPTPEDAPGLHRYFSRYNTADNVVDITLQPVPAPFPLHNPASMKYLLLSEGYEVDGLDDVPPPYIEPTPPGGVN